MFGGHRPQLEIVAGTPRPEHRSCSILRRSEGEAAVKAGSRLAIVLGVGLFIWGFTGYTTRFAWSDAHQLRMALGAMLIVGGFLWRFS